MAGPPRVASSAPADVRRLHLVFPKRPALRNVTFTALLSANDRGFLSYGHEEEASIWDLEAPQPQLTRRRLRTGGGSFSAAAFSPDNHWLVTGASDGEVRVWDLSVPDVEQSAVVLSTPGYVDSVLVAPNGRWFVTGGANTVAWHLGSDALLDLAARTTGRALSPEERQFYGAHLSRPETPGSN